MFFSVYPTDKIQDIHSVLEMALSQNLKLVFTSLHIPESSDLKRYMSFLKEMHISKGFSFFADISPLTLEKLGLRIKNLNSLIEAGIAGLRIDFGFNIENIRQIASNGFKIALNASIAQEDIIDALIDFNPIGWHNYYPRPETGINEIFFENQTSLFTKRGLPVYTFIPGEKNLRAPLFFGLPTLESHRYKNVYRNYMEFALKYPNIKVFCAEGCIHQKHLDWISEYENYNVITLPVFCTDSRIHKILEKNIFTIRYEQTDCSFRLENTRSKIKIHKKIQNEIRNKGSLQMDTEQFGRYHGEIHIMKKDMPLHPYIDHIADIADSYKIILDFLRGGEKVRFIKL
jgi:hypothetical protein